MCGGWILAVLAVGVYRVAMGEQPFEGISSDANRALRDVDRWLRTQPHPTDVVGALNAVRVAHRAAAAAEGELIVYYLRSAGLEDDAELPAELRDAADIINE